jgi:uncharacterized SAM-dependent methyltransferase
MLTAARDTRKVAHLLAIFDRLDIPATYLALDISRDSLARGVGDIACRYDHIQCVGLWGSFNDMHLYLRHLDDRPRLFLSLGSVLFNDATEKAVKSLRTWAKRLRDQDMILAGMDGHRAPEDYSKLMASYHGKGGEDLWNRFWKNGFKRLNMIVGSKLFRLEDWEVHGKIQNSPTEGVSHQFTFEARRNVAMDVLGIKFAKGEKFDWFDAHKNGEDQVRQMCDEVGLEVVKVWKKPGSRMSKSTCYRQLHRLLASLRPCKPIYLPCRYLILTAQQPNTSSGAGAPKSRRSRQDTPTLVVVDYVDCIISVFQVLKGVSKVYCCG